MTPWRRHLDRMSATSVQTIIRRVADGDRTVEDAIDDLRDAEFGDDAPEDRLRRIVEAAANREGGADDNTVSLSQPPSTDRQPRDRPRRYTNIEDIAYLSDKEFARLLGAVFEWFGGGTVRPSENDDVVLDLYWNRQHTTVGFRTVVHPDGDQVSEDTLRAVVNGDTDLDGRRAPSTIAVVTNTGFTPPAEEGAPKGDVELFDGPYVATWLRQVQFPPDVTGAVLEEGENHDGNLSDLVDLPPAPAYVSDTDPLAMSPTAAAEDAGPGGTGPGTVKDDVDGKEQIPVDEDLPEDGATGTLYADPREDGDYAALDRFVDGMEETDTEQ
ncbi:hypothetical protein SAMN05216218_11295 [Halorientalis regularis]|uniref:Restriction endonuclease n=2 Tax=Halorientalis regularis TaxID=660518 RepID=A0A1G7QDH1_9EURY|nr:hypothetical protein SAMN05216218_11295 [Halorientalis regularis]